MVGQPVLVDPVTEEVVALCAAEPTRVIVLSESPLLKAQRLVLVVEDGAKDLAGDAVLKAGAFVISRGDGEDERGHQMTPSSAVGGATGAQWV